MASKGPYSGGGDNGGDAIVKSMAIKAPKSHGTGLVPTFTSMSQKGPHAYNPSRTSSNASSQASQKDTEEERRVTQQMEQMLRENFGSLKHEEEDE